MDRELERLLEDLERGSYASAEEARRARREAKEHMEKIAKAYYESLDESGRARLDETRQKSEAIMAMYEWSDTVEAALIRYELALSKPERDALRGDTLRSDALSRLFFGAKTLEDLQRYAGMTVDELVKLAADLDAASIGNMTVDKLVKLATNLGAPAIGDMTVDELTKLSAATIGSMTVGELVKLAANLDAMAIGLQIRVLADAPRSSRTQKT